MTVHSKIIFKYYRFLNIIFYFICFLIIFYYISYNFVIFILYLEEHLDSFCPFNESPWDQKTQTVSKCQVFINILNLISVFIIFFVNLIISLCGSYYSFCVDRLYFYLALFLFHFNCYNIYCVNLNLFNFSFSFIFYLFRFSI